MFSKLLREAFASHGSGQTFDATHGGATRFDPYKSYKFLVEISGGANNFAFAKSGFQKSSGLKMNTDSTEYREGGDELTVIKTPGLTKFEPITLERGMSDDKDMWNYAIQALNPVDGTAQNDQATRCNIVKITLQDRNGMAVKKWVVKNAWVDQYETGDFDAMSNNVMIERIRLQHEGFYLDTV